MCVLWELNPQPFALLMQCSTTEPQEHMIYAYDLICFVYWPEIRRQGLSPYTSIDSCLRPQLFGRQKAVKSVENAGKADGFPPQRGWDGVNGTELRN